MPEMPIPIQCKDREGRDCFLNSTFIPLHLDLLYLTPELHFPKKIKINYSKLIVKPNIYVSSTLIIK